MSLINLINLAISVRQNRVNVLNFVPFYSIVKASIKGNDYSYKKLRHYVYVSPQKSFYMEKSYSQNNYAYRLIETINFNYLSFSFTNFYDYLFPMFLFLKNSNSVLMSGLNLLDRRLYFRWGYFYLRRLSRFRLLESVIFNSMSFKNRISYLYLRSKRTNQYLIFSYLNKIHFSKSVASLAPRKKNKVNKQLAFQVGNEFSEYVAKFRDKMPYKYLIVNFKNSYNYLKKYLMGLRKYHKHLFVNLVYFIKGYSLWFSRLTNYIKYRLIKRQRKEYYSLKKNFRRFFLDYVHNKNVNMETLPYKVPSKFEYLNRDLIHYLRLKISGHVPSLNRKYKLYDLIWNEFRRSNLGLKTKEIRKVLEFDHLAEMFSISKMFILVKQAQYQISLDFAQITKKQLFSRYINNNKLKFLSFKDKKWHNWYFYSKKLKLWSDKLFFIKAYADLSTVPFGGIKFRKRKLVYSI